MDLLKLIHTKAYEVGIFQFRWMVPENHLVRTTYRGPDDVSIEIGPAETDLIEALNLLKPQSMDDPDVVQFLQRLTKHCVCAAGHPLVSLYRTQPNACICGSYYELLENFAERYGLCAATGRPLNVDGYVEGFHCFSKSIEPTVKMILRYCQESS